MTTGHIRITREAWHAHWPTCPHCSVQKDFPDWCEIGQALFDEYRCAITAHRELETLIADSKEPT